MADGTISSTGNIATAQPAGVDFKVQPTNVAKSTSLAGGRTAQDLLNRRAELEQAAISANAPSQAETDLTEQLGQVKQLSRKAQLALSRETERLQTTPGLTQEISQNFTSDTARRYARTIGDLGVGASGIADALQAEVAKRTSAVSAAEGLLKADRESLSLLNDLQKMTRPDIIGSPSVNQLTGDITVIKQDPMTGSIVSEVIGNAGVSKNYIQSGTYQDASGAQKFWGLNSNGTIDTKSIDTAQTGTGVGASSYNPKQITAISKVNDAISKNATYANTVNMQKYSNNVNNALDQQTGVGDIAAINQFQKVIDEGAVTRDQDVKLIQDSQSFLNSLKTKVKKLEKGERLSPELRSQMRSVIQSVYDSQIDALNSDPYIASKTSELKLSGIDPKDTIIGELGSFGAKSRGVAPVMSNGVDLSEFNR